MMDIGLPTEKKRKNVENTGTEWGTSLVIARQIGIAQAHASAGIELSGGESGSYFNFGTVYPLGQWRATFELNGKIDERRIIYLTPGLVWKGLNDFEIGLGISQGITKNANSTGIILMITREFSLTPER